MLSLFISFLGFGLLADSFHNKIEVKKTRVMIISHNLGAAQPYEDYIYRASQKYDIEPELIAAVMFTESCGSYANGTCAWVNPNAISPTQDFGAMQVNISHIQNLSPGAIFDPAINIDIGSSILKEALNSREICDKNSHAKNGNCKLRHYYLALSAYNCGINCYYIQHQYSQKALRYYADLMLKKKTYIIWI